LILSPLGLAIIEQFEAFESQAYKDQRGVWTCGYGHTGPDVTETTSCTLDQGNAWLASDTSHAQQAVTAGISAPLPQHAFDALVSLVYNIGAGAFDSSTLRAQLNTGTPLVTAADQFLAWDHVSGVPNAGLLRRRRLERALFLDGMQA
jgi:lysozyme